MGTYDKNPILESIEFLCSNANPKVSFSKMCVDLGLSKSLNTKLKNNPGKTINGETAQKIADYFGVSVDRVLGSEQKEKSSTPEGVELTEKQKTAYELITNLSSVDLDRLIQIAEIIKNGG